MGGRRRGTVRGRLVATLLVVGLVPLLAVSAYAFAAQRDSLQDDALDHLASVASLQEARIETFVEHQLGIASLVASRTQLRASVANVIASGDPAEAKRATDILLDARSGTEGLVAIGVADTAGTVVVSTEPSRVGTPVGDRRLVARGRAQPAFGPVRTTPEGLQASVAAPAGLSDGTTAIVVVDLSLEPLVDLAGDFTGLGETGETVIVRREADGTAVYMTPLRFDPDAALDREVQADGEDRAVLRALGGEEAELTGTRDYREEAVLAATRNVSSTGWGVVVKIDRAEAFAPVDRLRDLLSAAVAAAVVVTAVVAWFVGRTLSRPLRNLRETAEAVRAGDLERRAEVAGSDEVATLAAAFNEMTERLLDINRTLEQRVQERTAELAESETRFRGAFDGAPVGMAITSLDGRYLEVNASLCRLLGRSEEELLGQRWNDLTHPDDRQVSRRFVDDALATGRTYTIEKRYLRPDDTPVWVLLSVSVLRDREGAPVRFLAHVQDINTRKQAEEALTRSNEALEQFAYVASHDLHEPLRVVAGFADVIERRYADRLPGDAGELLGYVRGGVERMKQLLSDLLELARVQRQPVEPRSVPLGEVMEGIVADLGAAVAEGDVTVAHDGLPVIAGDPGLLTRALHNLVANAVKFRAPDRPPRVAVSAHRLGGEWRVEVADNGIGIDPEDRERVFGMFERLHGREDYPGTGIGLAIVAACVDRLGGRLGVDETPGGGCTFWFTLPDAPSRTFDATPSVPSPT